MAVSNVPQFTQTPYGNACVQMTAANTARDGSGTVYSPAAFGANGAIVSAVIFQAQVTTAAGLVRIFWNGGSGTSKFLLQEIPTNAVTVSGTVGGDRHVWYPDTKMVVQSGAIFYFNTNNAETWNVTLIAENL